MSSRGKAPFSSKVRYITPTMAKNLLDTLSHEHNRPFHPSNLLRISSDMTGGLWRENGESIIVGWDDSLLDGRHRLQAVVDSDKGAWFVFVLGVDPAVFTSIDRGVPKSVGDMFSIAGYPNYKALASAIKPLMRLELMGRLGAMGGNTTPDNEVFLDFAEQFNSVAAQHTLSDSVSKWQMRAGKPSGTALVPAAVCATHYLFSVATSVEMANAFFEGVLTGIGLQDVKDPRYVLRARMQQATSGLPQHRVDRERVWVFLIKSWNRFITGERMTILKHIEAGDKRTGNFPRVNCWATPQEFPAAADAKAFKVVPTKVSPWVEK